MKSIKIYSQVPNGIVVNITNNYQAKPYISITENNGTIITFYDKSEYDAYLEFRKDSI